MTLKEKTKEDITKPEDVFKLVSSLQIDKDRENVIVLGLDSRKKVEYVELAHIGTLDETLMGIREIFKMAIVKNASSIIVCHNHPSQDVTPSKEDITVTEKLARAGELLKIPVLDHLVFSDNDYFSIKASNLLDKAVSK